MTDEPTIQGPAPTMPAQGLELSLEKLAAENAARNYRYSDAYVAANPPPPSYRPPGPGEPFTSRSTPGDGPMRVDQTPKP